MAQTSNTATRKVAAEIKAVGERMTDNTRAMADKGREMAQDAEKASVAIVEQTAAKTSAAVDQVASQITRTADVTPVIGHDVAVIWRDLVQGQLAHNVETFRRLSASRDWRESFAAQSDYLSGNLTRMSEAASRYAELTSKMMQDLLTSGSQMLKAARSTA